MPTGQPRDADTDLAADAHCEAERQMLGKFPFKMHFDATLIICRCIHCIESEAERARSLDAGFKAQKSVGAF